MAIDKVAKPYAKTLIEAADESGKLDEIIADVKTLKLALENRDLDRMFKSPVVNTSKKKKVVKKVFEGKLSDLTMRFMDVILRKKREPLIGDIILAAEEFILEKKDITKVVISTATEVTEETLKNIKEKVRSMGETRSQLEVEHQIDRALIGGFKAEFDSKVIDASVAHKLRELRRSFN